MTEKRKTSDLVKRARAFRRFDRDCTCPGLISDLASRVDTLERQTDDASKILNLEDRWPELPIRALAERATNHLDGERVIAERRAERAEARVAQLEAHCEAVGEATKMRGDRAIAAEEMKRAIADAAYFEEMAEKTTKSLVDAFTADVLDSLRVAINKLTEGADEGLSHAVRESFGHVADRLAAFLEFFNVQRLSEQDAAEPRFRASIPLVDRLPAGYGDTPVVALMHLVEGIRAQMDLRDEALREENHFKGALRHVETDMRTAMGAFANIMARVTSSLDGEDGTARGVFVNIPTPREQPSPCVRRLVPDKERTQAAYLADGTKLRIVREGRAAWLEHVPLDEVHPQDGGES
jgi:hypothetical protein